MACEDHYYTYYSLKNRVFTTETTRTVVTLLLDADCVVICKVNKNKIFYKEQEGLGAIATRL